MDIENFAKIESYLTIEDVNPGECFMFVGCTMVCLMLSNGNFVDLSNGEYYHHLDEEENEEEHWTIRPIKRVYAKVVIKE